MKSILKYLIIVVVLGAVAWGGYIGYSGYATPETKLEFKTETIERRDVIRSISATGTVEPEDLIDVGAQVTGKVMKFGVDAEGNSVDFGSRVKAGDVLAYIDEVTYKAEYDQDKASVEQAKANILSAEASIKEAEANEVLAKHNWERAQQLIKANSITKLDYDSYQAADLAATAQTAQAKATLLQTKAALEMAEAAMVKSKRNLEYCVITTPVDGIIIDRRVSVGQTVVSSQSASNIFLVAKDFKKMQVWVSVNEADIGSIKKGMDVLFSCDAFAGEIFKGVVHRVRYNATLSSNVVTYIVEVNADNEEGMLIPYLTANVKFVRAAKYDVLAVTTGALRYTPSEELMSSPAPEIAPHEGILWRIEGDNKVAPVVVRTGLTNGSYIVVNSPEIKEGDKFVTGAEVVSATTVEGSGGSSSNPFMPNMPKRPQSGSAAQRDRSAERQK